MQRDRARAAQIRAADPNLQTCDEQNTPSDSAARSSSGAGAHVHHEVTITLRDGRIFAVPRSTDGTFMTTSRADFESAYATLNGSTPGGGWNDFEVADGRYYEVDTQDAWELWQAAQFAVGT
jgi:hypothetical protein